MLARKRQPSPSVLSVREYGVIARGSQPRQVSAREIELPDKDFEELKARLLQLDTDDDADRIFQVAILHGREVLRLRSYAGIVQTSSGIQVEILPKLYAANTCEDSAGHARSLLLKMLIGCGLVPARRLGAAGLSSEQVPLLEVFIAAFLEEVNHVVKRGIRSDYLLQTVESAFVKGKVMVSRQMRKGPAKQNIFSLEHDEYLPDRSENRLLHSALRFVLSATRETENQRLARELLFAFDDVAESRDVRQDLASCDTGRLMAHYSAAIRWCAILLSRKAPSPTAGAHQTLSILFPMEVVFERYVARWMKHAFPQTHVTTQAASEYLATQTNGKKWFRLKPDLLIAGPTRKVVADTKWKLLDQHDRANRFGIAQSDIYQMYAYAKKYLAEEAFAPVVLIYPRTDAFSEPLETFDYDERARLFVVPFDLENDCCPGLQEVIR